MSNKQLNRRRKTQRFRPSGGMKNQLKREEPVEKGRADIEDGRVLDEPVYEKHHEAEILAAENEAAGIKPEPEEVIKESTETKPKKPVEEKGVMASVKRAAQKIIRKLLPKQESDKEIIISAESLETRVALVEKGVLEDFTIERNNDERIVASIYKGKVRNLEDRLEAAFVDIGIEKNAFLHYWDITPTNLDNRYEMVERKGKRRSTPRLTRKDIPKKYPVGSDIVIQVTKGPIGTKGPRVTTHLAIPGRFIVLLPASDQLGISKKVQDPQERRRLKEILRSLDIPDNMGAIIRTAGEGQKQRYFVRDLAMLKETWETVKQRIDNKPSPICAFRDPDLIERTVRDFLTEDVHRILIDNKSEYERMQKLIERISPRSKNKLEYYGEPQPIFDKLNISRQLGQAFSRKVTLKGGGAIVIDETEALVAIDVNTGSHKGGKDQSSTILKVNLESAEEICRQLRLRNMGGLVVVDFIDMKQRRDRDKVMQRMKEGLRRDKAKTHVLPISQLGLLEMTRQRHSESVLSTFYDECDYCKGRGHIKTPVTMSVEIQRKLDELLRKRQPGDDDDYQLRIVVNPNVLDRLRREDEDILINLEKKHLVKLAFRGDTSFHAEQFKIFDGLKNRELVSVGETVS